MPDSDPVSPASAPSEGPAAVTLAYHARTKHHIERYARGPETLDWDMQPDPFRTFAGCTRIELPLMADRLSTPFGQIHLPGAVTPAALSVATVGALLELSMGLSAWKEYGPDRWAVRCNPSSGNLHPTEVYILCGDVPGLDDGLYHYLSRDHTLEQRCRVMVRSGDLTPGSPAGGRLWIGLSSIQWREAWKYGERAFRYCQLDIGHALGAVRYAAGALGWVAGIVTGLGHAELAALMGLDRPDDFAGVEREDPDLLVAIDPFPAVNRGGHGHCRPVVPEPATGRWSGRANRLDPHPVYQWPVIDAVSRATQGRPSSPRSADPVRSPSPAHPSARRLGKRDADRAAAIILNRRSAQRFDRHFVMTAPVFYHMLDGMLVRTGVPWDVWDHPPWLHPIFFIHRIEGLDPGIYALPRHPDAERSLRESLRSDFVWQKPDGVPVHLPFFRLAAADCRAASRTMNCHQAIAAESCFSLSMLGAFAPIVAADPWHYRLLHWEAGLLGQVLYLEAEAAGLNGTGIGCYFDDALHDLLGLTSDRFQALYHFTVGRALVDGRIATSPAYPGRIFPHSEEQSP